MQTDTEFFGLGESCAGYFCPEIVPSIVDFVKPVLMGEGVVTSRMERG
jgi:hypothetical protein